MKRNGRELTCRNLHDIMDELLNVCINGEEDYIDTSHLVAAYNDIKENAISGVDDEKYPFLEQIGNYDGVNREYIKDGVIHNNGTDWEVIAYRECFDVSAAAMKVCFPEDYDYPSIQGHEFYDVYITVDGHRVIVPELN